MKHEVKFDRVHPEFELPRIDARRGLLAPLSSFSSPGLVAPVLRLRLTGEILSVKVSSGNDALEVKYWLKTDSGAFVFIDSMQLWHHESESARMVNRDVLVPRMLLAAGVACPDLRIHSAEPFQALVGRAVAIQIEESPSSGPGRYRCYVSWWDFPCPPATVQNSPINSNSSGPQNNIPYIQTHTPIKPGRDAGDWCRSIGRRVCELFDGSPITDPDAPLPVHVYVEREGACRYLEYEPALQLMVPEVPSRTGGIELFLVGYDVETYKPEPSSEPCLLSHQLYFAQGLPDGSVKRVGVVFIMSERLSEAGFLSIIEAVVPAAVKKAYVSAHFSLVECGWLIPSMRDVKTKTGKTYRSPTIPIRGKKWCDILRLPRTKTPPKSDVKKPRKSKKPPKPEKPAELLVQFVDSCNYVQSLDGVGKAIGIKKMKHEFISCMDKFLLEHPAEFCVYGMIDALITAEAIPYFASAFHALGLECGVRNSVPSYAEAYFKQVFCEIYGKKFRPWLGWESFKRAGAQLDEFIGFYYGGRNEVAAVGPRGVCDYYDLTSAYPMAIVAQGLDYRYDEMIVSCSAAEARIDALRSAGPFQTAGVRMSWCFKKDATPAFPVRVDEGLIFPRRGQGSVMWPELWVALEMGLLERYEVFRVYEFPRLESSILSKRMRELLEMRFANGGTNKDTVKLLANSFYGKTAQGVRGKLKPTIGAGIGFYDEFIFSTSGKTPPSQITCYPIAAYASSVCRAAMAELANANPWYAITTDGFISPARELKFGPLCKKLETLVPVAFPAGAGGKRLVKSDFAAEKALFLRTRGYVLVNGKTAKVAKMGVQVERDEPVPEDDDELNPVLWVEEADAGPGVKEQAWNDVPKFLAALNAGKFVKKSWPSLSKLREAQVVPTRRKATPRARVPMLIESVVTADSGFDYKRLPFQPSMQVGFFQLVKYAFVCESYDTVPLESAEDFVTARRVRPWRESGWTRVTQVFAELWKAGVRNAGIVYADWPEVDDDVLPSWIDPKSLDVVDGKRALIKALYDWGVAYSWWAVIAELAFVDQVDCSVLSFAQFAELFESYVRQQQIPLML